MSKQNIPFFEIDGNRYEIKRTRYLQAEFDAMKSDLDMTDEEQIAFAKEQELDERLEKLVARKNELYDKYLETFSEEDEALYKKACAAYDAVVDSYGSMESINAKQRKKMVDMGEKLIIKSLQIDNKGNTIRTQEDADELWSRFVEEVGQANTIAFVLFALNYIIGNDDEIENPFLTQAKARAEQKAEQKANMRKGIVKAN